MACYEEKTASCLETGTDKMLETGAREQIEVRSCGGLITRRRMLCSRIFNMFPKVTSIIHFNRCVYCSCRHSHNRRIISKQLAPITSLRQTQRRCLQMNNMFFSTMKILENNLENGQKEKNIKIKTLIPASDGFVSMHDLVKFLLQEGAIDLCVIATSGKRKAYVDYFVVVSGASSRHLRTMAKNLEYQFRGHEVRGIGKSGHVTIEGLESDHWLVTDIGNAVVHFFLPEVRTIYELEKLWTLGPQYDDQYRAMLEEDERSVGNIEKD